MHKLSSSYQETNVLNKFFLLLLYFLLFILSFQLFNYYFLIIRVDFQSIDINTKEATWQCDRVWISPMVHISVNERIWYNDYLFREFWNWKQPFIEWESNTLIHHFRINSRIQNWCLPLSFKYACPMYNHTVYFHVTLPCDLKPFHLTLLVPLFNSLDRLRFHQ